MTPIFLVKRYDYLAKYGTLRHPKKSDWGWSKKRFRPLTGRRYRQACREWQRCNRALRKVL